MATIETHVSILRTKIKAFSDDTIYTNQFLYQLLRMARARLIRNELRNKSFIPDYYYQKVCVSLTDEEFVDCDCVPGSGCLIRTSSCDIPSSISHRTGSTIKVMTPAGKPIPYVPLYKIKGKSYSKSRSAFYTFIGKKLKVFSSELSVAVILAVFDDPQEVFDCGCSNSTEGDCDSLGDDFPIDAHLEEAMYRMSLNMLGVSMQIVDDKINDGRTES